MDAEKEVRAEMEKVLRLNADGRQMDDLVVALSKWILALSVETSEEIIDSK